MCKCKLLKYLSWSCQSRVGRSQLELEDEVATDLQRATGMADENASSAGRLSRVLQLTGAAFWPRPGCGLALLPKAGSLLATQYFH